MNFKTLIIFTTIAVFLNACTLLTPEPEMQKVSWQVRKQQLSTVQQWDIKGLIGIRTEADNVSANIQWKQYRNNYTLLIFGPLGIGRTFIEGSANQVTLKKADLTLVAKSPEHLLMQQLGWYLPISNMHYWVRGLPVPNLKATKTFDSYNHLSQLKQDGWEVSFKNYETVKNQDLPHKIELHHPDLKIRMVIKQWGL